MKKNTGIKKWTNRVWVQIQNKKPKKVVYIGWSMCKKKKQI
jgi:hypothetical protein